MLGLEFSLGVLPPKQSGHMGLRFSGLLSFFDPLMWMKCGSLVPESFTEHSWQRYFDLSKTVCLVAKVNCLYLSLFFFPEEFPKKDNEYFITFLT